VRAWVWTECDVVAAIVPLVAGAGEEVFDFEVLVVGDCKLFEVEVDPAGLLLHGVEVDGDENCVRAAGFAVAEDAGIVGRMEVEGPVAVECGVVAADLVELRDERGEAVGGGAVPAADLVFSLLRYSSSPSGPRQRGLFDEPGDHLVGQLPLDERPRRSAAAGARAPGRRGPGCRRG